MNVTIYLINILLISYSVLYEFNKYIKIHYFNIISS